MITWDYFVKVRRLKVQEWLANRNVKSYVDFLKRLKDLGVSPVPEEVFLKMIPPVTEATVSAEACQPEHLDPLFSHDGNDGLVVAPDLDKVVQEMTDQAEQDITTYRKKKVRKEST